MDGLGTTSPPPSSLQSSSGADLNSFLEGGAEGINLLDTIHDRPLEPGEKADDAIDYEDISDDDLADDDDAGMGGAVKPPAGQTAQTDGFLEGIFEEANQADQGDENDDIGFDDLFGDDEDEAPPAIEATGPSQTQPQQNGIKKSTPGLGLSDDEDDDLIAEDSPMAGNGLAGLEELDLDEQQNKEYMLQQALFARSGPITDIPNNEEDNDAELLRLVWPKFDRDIFPKWHELLPPRRLPYNLKTPAKPPKPVRPTKVNLEIDLDQKALFNSGLPSNKRSWDSEYGGIVPIEKEAEDETPSEAEDLDWDQDADQPLPGGITEQDLKVLCADWDTLSGLSEEPNYQAVHEIDSDDLFADGFETLEQPPAKKRKTGRGPEEIASVFMYDLPAFDDPEEMAAKVARKVILDLNDPHLLLEKVDPQHVARAQVSNVKESSNSIKDKLASRFNHSNDAEYDMLKQNHQNKVRSTLGNLEIQHSLPAVRLQYPYYKVKLPTDEARAHHRKPAVFKPLIYNAFNRVSKQKRKHMKGKKVTEIFESTKDLPMGDNSTSLLLEYSEEYPMMLSQIGMGSRIVNYYRRRNKDDNNRPKGEIGETAVLLPEDKSPFHIFGHIEPGETVAALYNSMYRAPVFEHQPRSRDFLMVRSQTGEGGIKWFLRNVDHVCAVGQQFPSVDVPGPHSRKVTTASKNRLKMISFRIIRKRKSGRIGVGDVTKHFPDTTDMQNRQKMKEFLAFNRDAREWEMKKGDVVPDEDVLQNYLKPEDVCLLESMQVGSRYLHDAGIQDDNDEDDDKEGQNLEQQLAPWHTSRNFINATQNKAMLQLHGEGDPSGRGEAFSFIKTSMKGGFKALGESVTDKMASMKELNGHSYNVARQQKAYEDSIRRIWEAQKAALSSNMDHSSDAEMDDAQEEDDANEVSKAPPRSETATPAPWDEGRSQITSVSNISQSSNILRIRRTVKRNGQYEEVEEIIKDPGVIRQYKRRKLAQEANELALSNIIPTGETAHDARMKQRLEAELARLEKNRERRYAREKAKGRDPTASAISPGSPDSPATGPGVGTGKVAGTQRKCANCGQVGHIKTNKKWVCSHCKFPNKAWRGGPRKNAQAGVDSDSIQSLGADGFMSAMPVFF